MSKINTHNEGFIYIFGTYLFFDYCVVICFLKIPYDVLCLINVRIKSRAYDYDGQMRTNPFSALLFIRKLFAPRWLTIAAAAGTNVRSSSTDAWEYVHHHYKRPNHEKLNSAFFLITLIFWYFLFFKNF